ncbi:pts system mannitol-specific eiicba component, partial [Salmonella enterica subsp. enterica serovar Montevideo str. MB110209-0055]
MLMNPRLILAVILGGMTGVFTLTILNGVWSLRFSWL